MSESGEMLEGLDRLLNVPTVTVTIRGVDLRMPDVLMSDRAMASIYLDRHYALLLERGEPVAASMELAKVGEILLVSKDPATGKPWNPGLSRKHLDAFSMTDWATIAEGVSRVMDIEALLGKVEALTERMMELHKKLNPEYWQKSRQGSASISPSTESPSGTDGR